MVFPPLLRRRSTLSPSIDSPAQPEIDKNIVGALIFFSYIGAALIFTGLILSDIVHRADGNKIQKSEQRTRSLDRNGLENTRKETKRADSHGRKGGRIIFPALAFISFGVLSWNMVNFLVASYSQWAKVYEAPNAFQMAKHTQIRQYSHYIWQWSIQSNLFESFAEDLLRDNETWRHVRMALLYTYAWNVWMSFIGTSLI
jgi:hypothetical protein